MQNPGILRGHSCGGTDRLLPSRGPLFLLLTTVLLAGCQADKSGEAKVPAPTAATAVAPAQAPASAAPETAPLNGIVRIKAGNSAPFTDSSGNVWLPDQGFEGGDTVERADDIEIANTKDHALYRTEHYSMDSFSRKLANGKYLVKLHFAETFEGIEGPGQRVFSFKVAGHEFKDFDIWVKAGGPRRAYIEAIPVEVTDGKLQITFQSGVENPAVNAIEILPQP